MSSFHMIERSCPVCERDVEITTDDYEGVVECECCKAKLIVRVGESPDQEDPQIWLERNE